MAAQLAPFPMVEWMPYFLNRPFSWAITIGEQSVSAIMPKRMSVTSGPLVGLAAAVGAGAAGSAAGAGAALPDSELELQAAPASAPAAPATPAAPNLRNERRDKEDALSEV